jgi:PKD repeat protein
LFSRRAITTAQVAIIIVIVVIAAVAAWYMTLPEPAPPENRAPKASASVSDTLGLVGTALTFSGAGSSDPDGEIASYSWDFGDGSTGTGESVDHTYDNPGSYIVVLTVEDDKGATDDNEDDLLKLEVTRESFVPVLTSPPLALFASDKDTIVVGDEVNFDGSSSVGWYERRGAATATTAEIIEYEWDFGDGDTASGPIVSHTFSDAGNFAVSLTVKANNTGMYDTAMKTIHVSEMAIQRPDVPNPDTYTFASSITSRTVDPVECTGASCRMALIAITEGLVWYPPGGTEIVPRLAESWTLSPDQTKYTFKLREGVKFWNGDELTADDVVYSFQRYLIMNLPGTWCDD